ASRPARGQADVPGARAVGMGEAMRAVPSGAEAPLLNPAGMSLARQYVIEAMYGFRVESLGHQAHVSVVDSVTAKLAAGLFYTFVYETPKLGFKWAGGQVDSTTITRTGHAAGLALSYPLGDRFIIGATVKYLHLDSTAPLPPMTVPPQITLDTVNGVTFDVGMILRLGDKFNIGLVGQNLWDHGSRESPLLLGIGLAYVPVRVVTLAFDTTINFTGYQSYKLDMATQKLSLDGRVAARLGPGIEFLAGSKVPLRAGVVYDSGLPATYLTLGVGYLSPTFGIDLGYRVKLQGGIENFLQIGFRLFID
ncbi:MAG TPA: hypothetical protein VFF06_24290, partial [Polyangia bacterium]|nr:hypothetical protein [Polyangia bacterium]